MQGSSSGSQREQPSALRKREGDSVRSTHRSGIVIGAVQVKGITSLLRDECYPRYDYDLAIHGDFDEDEPRITQSVGQEVGRLVDRQVPVLLLNSLSPCAAQITALVRLMWTYGLDWSHIPGASTAPHPRAPPIMKQKDADKLRAMQRLHGSDRNKTHAFTREFFRQLRSNSMIPVHSQVKARAAWLLEY